MARDTVLTGYYRYTDIWFEWYCAFKASEFIRLNSHLLFRAQALPDVEDGEPLKAVLGQFG